MHKISVSFLAIFSTIIISLFFDARSLKASNSEAPLQKKVIFLGDSLTAGYALPPQASYPSQLKLLAEKDSKRLAVLNAAVSGDTTSGLLRRLPFVKFEGADLVVIAIGANDGLRGLNLEIISDNIKKIVSQVSKNVKKERIILIGMKMPPNFGEEYAQDFFKMFSTLAEELSLPYLPFLLEPIAERAEYFQSDMMHPNQEGTKLVAKHVYSFIKGKLD
jgi:acyl-CoA thioesterase-1